MIELKWINTSFFVSFFSDRHTLWRCLQTALTPVLARVLEVLDRDANLDLAYCAGLSDGLIGLWLDIASDQQILDLTLIHTSR